MVAMSLDEIVANLTEDAQVAAVVCNQWGDTGKGKITDLLAAHWVDVDGRGTGGANAGHTVRSRGKEFIFHLLPAGVTYDGRGVISIMGNGMAISPKALCKELDQLEEVGGSYNNLRISRDAAVVMPYHIDFDLKNNQSQRNGGIGTTGRGIGPAYTDKVGRWGITMADLLDRDALVRKIEKAKGFYPNENIEVDRVLTEMQPFVDRLAPMITDTVSEMHGLYRAGKKILLEGAQGLLLSIEHGTSPGCTSSDCSVAGTANGVGLSARAIDEVFGIFKFPFMTRVGAGPFPTELGGRDSEKYCAEVDPEDPTKAKYRKEVEANMHPDWREMMNSSDDFIRGVGIRIAAGEYGASTGRPRRVGWFDLVAARYAAMINGPMKAILTKPDSIEGMDSFRLATSYRTPHGETQDFMRDPRFLSSAQPVYETYGGFGKGSVSGARSYDELPKSLRAAIERFESFVGTKVAAIGNGAETDKIIVR